MENKKDIIDETKLKMTCCKRCKRKLRKPENMNLGMGAKCYKKFLTENSHKKLF